MGHEYRLHRHGIRSPDRSRITDFKDTNPDPVFHVMVEPDASVYFLAHIWSDETRLVFSRLILHLLETSDSVTISEL